MPPRVVTHDQTLICSKSWCSGVARQLIDFFSAFRRSEKKSVTVYGDFYVCMMISSYVLDWSSPPCTVDSAVSNIFYGTIAGFQLKCPVRINL